MRQVFDNLLSNATKFVPENKGKIEVGSMKENDTLVFYVKDNGIGMLPEKQKNLFQKFYQIDTSERRSAGGTGLGLAIKGHNRETERHYLSSKRYENRNDIFHMITLKFECDYKIVI